MAASDMDAAKLLQMEEGDLYATIGGHLAGRQAFPASRTELVERGRAWYQAQLGDIRAAVCPHAERLTRQTDAQAALLAIADLLAGVVFQVAPINVAALIVKAGVKTLCDADSRSS